MTKAVLFDLDGTLADTETLKARALSLAVHELSGKETSPEIYKEVMGQSWEIVTAAFFRTSALDVSLEVFNPVFRKYYGDLIDSELTDKRGARLFLETLKAQDLQLGLVSSASSWMINKALDKIGIGPLFDVTISGQDVKNHKPHPEAYLHAMERLSIIASRAIAFEDSESGFKSATAAGMAVYGIKHEYNQKHDFELCKKVGSNFQEFQLHLR